jgi:hypothetical protein
VALVLLGLGLKIRQLEAQRRSLEAQHRSGAGSSPSR